MELQRAYRTQEELVRYRANKIVGLREARDDARLKKEVRPLPRLHRACRTQERRVRYWASKTVELCDAIDDVSLEEGIAPVLEADAELRRDRRVMVIGSKQCGKSSLLAWLAEAPPIAAYQMPEGAAHVCWRFSNAQQEEAGPARYLPQDHLDGLELVDTADCGGAGAETCRELLRGADVVVAVVDSRAPESAPVWDLLADITEPQSTAAVLAVTFSDTLGAEEMLKLKTTLGELCSDKLGRALPFYIVSPGEKGAMSEFRDYVLELVEAAPALRSSIRKLASCTMDLLDRQNSILQARQHASRMKNSFLEGIAQEINSCQQSQLNEVSKLQKWLSNSLLQVVPGLLRSVRNSFGWILSATTLLRLELMGGQADRTLYRQMADNVQAMLAEVDEQFVVNYCSKHWQHVRPRMQKTLSCEIGEFPEDALREELEELRKRLCHDMYEPSADRSLRIELSALFLAQVGWMRACIVFICILLAVGGLLGYMGQDALGVCCVLLAALVWMLGSVGHHIAYRHICADITKLAQQQCLDMEVSMRSVLEQFIISRVAAYRRLYAAPCDKVARQDSMLKPLKENRDYIRLSLSALKPKL